MHIFPAPHTQSSNDLSSLFSTLDNLVTGYHIDVMDGQFVPARMTSVEFTNQIDTLTDNILWVHLMVRNPRLYMTELEIKAGSIITFHYEAVSSADIESLAEYCEQRQWRASLALNPETSLDRVKPFFHHFDHITLMAVQPGAAGQEFIQSSFEKIKQLEAYRATQESSFEIAVDGGITQEIISQLAVLDVDAIATHSAVFKNNTPRQNMQALIKHLKSSA